MRAILRNTQFFSAALPLILGPPMMNRYAEGMDYGDHCNAAILGGGTPMRAVLSAALFLSDPADYDGGELVTDVTPGGYAAKLPAGDLILYQANTVHHVAEVTRGTRIAMIFWVRSMVRDARQRAMLHSMFQTLEALEKPLAGRTELTQLYTYYYNLIRMWATP